MPHQLLTATLAATVLVLFSGPVTTQVHVAASATGTNKGTSWKNAYRDLATALAATSQGEVWIARGSYKPARQSHCCIQNYLTGVPGEDPPDPKELPGCTLEDPLFVNATARDFRLGAASPCIDTGKPASLARGIDLFGNLRRLDGRLDGVWRVDMGAHEFSNVSLAATVTPLGPGLGEIFFSLSGPVFVFPLGTIPSSLAQHVPSAGLDATLQALAVGGRGANLSNPVRLRFP